MKNNIYGGWGIFFVCGVLLFALYLATGAASAGRPMAQAAALAQANPAPAPYYTYTVIAQTDGINLNEIKEGVSINLRGAVAFAGKPAGGGDALFVGDGSSPPRIIAGGADATGNYRFSPGVQINNSEQVVAQDQQPGVVSTLSKIRLWDGNATDSWEQLASGQFNNTGADYDAVFAYPSLNNRQQIVFSALVSHRPAYPESNCASFCLALTKPPVEPAGAYPFYEVPAQTSMRPLLADDGSVVVRAGSAPNAPIVHYRGSLADDDTIASAEMGFTELGRNPGISDDGTIIAFYGSLSTTGATQLGMAPGPGIFAYINTRYGWVLRQVATAHGALTGFDPEARVAVNNVRKFVYVAYDTVGRKGLYSSQLNFFSTDPNDPTAFVPNAPPALVVNAGTRIQGLGVVQDFTIHDPLNDHGLVAFWVSTTAGNQAVVRAHWRCAGKDYSDSNTATYINQYAAGDVYGLPIRHRQRGGNACGPSSFTMLINAYEYASNSATRLDLADVYTATMSNPAEDEKNNLFDYWKGHAHALSLGYRRSRVITGKAEIDAELEQGRPVLVSTRFSSKNHPQLGGGHVVLFWGRTANGDYVVSDVSGDYFSATRKQYGKHSCGEYRLYQQAEVQRRLYAEDGVSGRSALMIHPLKRNRAPRAAAQSPDDEGGAQVLLVSARFSVGQARPYQIWLEDSSGNRTGFLIDGAQVEQIPGSLAALNPRFASDPDADTGEEVPREEWPYVVEILDPPAQVRAFVHGVEDTDYSLEVYLFDNGKMRSSVTHGAVAAGQTIETPIVLDQIGATPTATPTATETPTTTPVATATATETLIPTTMPTATPTSPPGSGGGTRALYLPVISRGSAAMVTSTPTGGAGAGGAAPSIYMPLIHGVNPTPPANPTPPPTVATPLPAPTVTPSPTPSPTDAPNATPTSQPTAQPPRLAAQPLGQGFSTTGAATFGLGALNALAVSPDGAKLAVGSKRGDAAVIDLNTGNILVRFGGHATAINAVAWAPNGEDIYTGSQDGIVRRWTAGGVLQGIFFRSEPGRRDYITSLAVSPDSAYLLAGVSSGSLLGEHDYVAILWEVATGIKVRLFDGHTNGLTAVAFAPDGASLATASLDYSVKLWQVADGAQIRTLGGHTSYVYALAFSADGASLVTGSLDRTARIWNLATGAFKVLAGHLDAINGVAFSPAGAQVLTVSSDKTARVWGATTGALLLVLDGHTAPLRAGAFQPATGHALTAGDDGVVRLWETTAPPTRTLRIQGAAIRAVAVSPDGNQVLIGSNDNAARLWNLAGGALLRTFEGHTQAINDVAFSTDGTRALTASYDTTARLWDVESGELLRTFSGHTRSVSGVAFSPDGGQVLTGSGDGTARLWDTETGEVLRTLSAPTGEVTAVAFAPDGLHVATADGNGTLRVWATADGSLVHTYRGHTWPVPVLRFSADSAYLFSASADATARRWRVSDGARRIFPRQYVATSADVTSDGKRLLVSGQHGVAEIWDTETGELVNIFVNRAVGRPPAFSAVAFSPDGNWVVTGEDDGRLLVWPAHAGAVVRTVRVGGHRYGIEALALAPDGGRLLSGGSDNTLLLWDVATAQPIRALHGHQRTIYSAAFSAGGEHALSGDGAGQIFLWDVAGATILRTFTLSSTSDIVLSVAFSPDEGRILAGASNKNAYLWDADSGELLRTLSGHAGSVEVVAFSPDGARILTGSNDHAALLWDANSGAILGSLGGHTDSITAVAFTPNGERVLTASLDGTARLWDPSTGATVQTFVYRQATAGDPRAVPVRAAAFSPDGARLLLGDNEKRAHLWDVASGRLLRVDEGHTGAVTAVVFTPDGSQVISAGSDGDHTVRLWGTTSAAPVRVLTGHTGGVQAAVFTADGTGALTGACDQTARLWHLDSGAEIHTFGGHLDTCITLAAVSADGVYGLTGTGAEARLWRLAGRKLVRTINGHSYALRAVGFSPDGTQVLTAGQDLNPASCLRDCGSVKLWDVTTGELRLRLTQPTGVYAAAFSPDGGRILTGDTEGTVRLWNASDGALLGVYGGHKQWVNAVAFSPDGARFLSGSADGTAFLWETAGGAILHIYTHAGPVTDVAFRADGAEAITSAGNSVYGWSATHGGLLYAAGHERMVASVDIAPDGLQLLTGSADGTARLWTLPVAEVNARG
ncbi:MAG: hypothetical protein DCC57_02565 [Chloroflexi bacterium]|nr:MAG: hypothetical protein DCC57_02565 [Chloroflexota bacterium]